MQLTPRLLVKGAVYGEDGKRLEAEDGSKYELIVVANDIYDGDEKTVSDRGWFCNHRKQQRYC